MKLKSLVCPCCHFSSDYEKFHDHHVLPLSLGGIDCDTNIIKICTECHGKIHDRKFLSNKTLIKSGLAKRKALGGVLGCPKGVKRREGKFKKHDQTLIERLRLLSTQFNCRQIAQKLNISAATVSRLQRKYKNEA